jgi:hypothetical protein
MTLEIINAFEMRNNTMLFGLSLWELVHTFDF